MQKKLRLIAILLLLTCHSVQAAQNSEAPQKFSIIGKASPRALLLGMWTTHLWTNEFGALQANGLVGFTDYGLFAGTFVNSYRHRSYAAGFNRYWFAKQLSQNTEVQLGYRLGLLYGYEKGEVLFSCYSPVIPFIQVFSDFNWKKLGFELSTTGQVISGGFFIKF